MQVYKWHHTASWEFLVSSAPRKSPRGMVFLFATARRSMRADSGSFAKALCQDSCQYVNYCLRALSCAFTKSLAVCLSSHASPLLQSYFFTTATEPLPTCKLLPAVFSLSLRNSPRCPPLCSHLVLALSHVLSVYRTIALSSASPFVCFHKIPRCPPLLSRLAAAPIVLDFHHCDRTIAERRVRRARG